MNEMIDVVDDDNKEKEEDFIKTSEIIVDVNEYEEVKKKVEVLNVVGMTIAEATNALKEINLGIEYETTEEDIS